MDAKERIDRHIIDKVIEEAEERAFIDRVIEEADREHAEYAVTSGAKVHMQNGEYLVTEIILGKELEEKFKPDHVWKLFTLVNVACGTNWHYPIPVMSEGSIDIRKLLKGGRVERITYKEGAGQKTRVYQIEEMDGYVGIATVTQNRGL